MKSLSLTDLIELPNPGHYVVAVSGGVDSIVLLHLLMEHVHRQAQDQSTNSLVYHERPGKSQGVEWRLRVAHFDHGWRSESSKDADFVAQMARIYDLPFHRKKAEGLKITEQAGREGRYGFLTQIAKTHGADGIITAHHLDDRQETSLFNLLRGTGWVGAAPMVNGQGKIIRPLMKAKKSQLYEYAKHHGLPWREDPSNRDLNFDRNFLRHEILPDARKTNPDFDRQYHDSLQKLDELNQRLNLEIDSWLRPAYRPKLQMYEFDRAALSKLSLVSLKQVIASACRRLQPAVQLSANLLNELALFTKKAEAGSKKSLPAELKLEIGYDKVAITFESSVKNGSGIESLEPRQLFPQTSQLFGQMLVSFGELPSPQVTIEPQPLMVRTFNTGDRIAPVGMVGRKKLQDLFVDAKVPRAERQTFPIVVDLQDAVVWVPGLAFSRHHLPAVGAPVYGLSIVKK